MSHGLANTMLHETERRMAGRYVERHGLVTSYDSKNYLCKVTFQPEGQESGWLPIETGHIGEGYGIAIGLQPGSGSGQQPQGGGGGQSQASGDQVVVRYQEGDIESGKVVQRVHSSQDTPPTTQSGEMIFWTVFKKDSNAGPDSAQTGQGGKGQQIYFKNDNSLNLTDGNGATEVYDGKGNYTVTSSSTT
jgi:hypothetical protein